MYNKPQNESHLQQPLKTEVVYPKSIITFYISKFLNIPLSFDKNTSQILKIIGRNEADNVDLTLVMLL